MPGPIGGTLDGRCRLFVYILDVAIEVELLGECLVAGGGFSTSWLDHGGHWLTI
jgi:hypothetical protein